MTIALVLVHNKGDQGNASQIETALSLLERKTETISVEGSFYDVSYYEFKLFPGHKVLPFHIVPYGVTRPANLDTLDGYKVLYGAGDEDKTGDHPRFFNWGLKRGTDHGADLAVQLQDVSKVNLRTLKAKLEELADADSTLEFIEEVGLKAGTKRLLKTVGQLDENLANPFEALKKKITDRGLRYG